MNQYTFKVTIWQGYVSRELITISTAARCSKHALKDVKQILFAEFNDVKEDNFTITLTAILKLS